MAAKKRGQLHMYLAAVDDTLKHPDDQPTIGLLVCRGKNEVVVEYVLELAHVRGDAPPSPSAEKPGRQAGKGMCHGR